jgi:predicted RNase H-like nuclease (RuvC/YqgF family)
MYMENEPTTRDLVNSIKDLTGFVDNLAITMAKGFENTATKEDLNKTNQIVARLDEKVTGLEQKITGIETNFINLQTSVNDIQSDIRSFRIETENNFKKVDEDIEELASTVLSYDRTIERLEEKVFA